MKYKRHSRKLLTTLVMLLMALGMQAQTMVPCVVVELKDGSTSEFPLSASPCVAYVEGQVQLTFSNNTQVLFDVADVAKVYLSEALLKGDANGDGVVDVADVVAIVNYILEKPAENFYKAAADVNGDTVIDAADVVSVVNIILFNNIEK